MKLEEYQDTLLGLFREQYRCPISKHRMDTPVVAEDGISYQESAIQDWIEDHDFYPDSIESIISGNLIDNVTLCSMINTVEKEVPKIVSIIKNLKKQIQFHKLEINTLKSRIYNRDTYHDKNSPNQQNPHQTILFKSNYQSSMIPEDDMAENMQEPKKRQGLKSKLNQQNYQNDDRKENMDNNRTDSVDQAPEKRKMIKKKKNQKLKANFQKEKAQESQEEENLNFSEIDKFQRESIAGPKLIQIQSKNSNQKIEKLRQEISLLCERILQLEGQNAELQKIKAENSGINQSFDQFNVNEAKYKLQIAEITKLKDGYLIQRDNLLAKLQNQHMTWMFIFSTYEEAIFSYVKETQIKEKEIQQVSKTIKNANQIKQNSIPNDQPHVGYLSDSSDQFPLITKRLKRKKNPKVTKAIKNLEEQYKDGKQKQQKQAKIVSEIEEERMKQNKLKSEITSRIQLLRIIVSARLKQNPDIDPKAVKQVKNFYKKITLLSKTLRDQTPLNLWNSYKFYTFYMKNQNNNIKYGYQIDCGCLLKILRSFGEKSLEWPEVKSIKAHNSGISDADWKYLVKYSHLLPDVREIDLEGNKISKVSQNDLECWKKLFKINLGKNPLNEESIQVLKEFL